MMMAILSSLRRIGKVLPRRVARKCADAEAARLQRRIARRKAEAASAGYRYDDHPDMTAIVQFFNHRPQIPELISRLQGAFQELIVIDDGSIDGSYRDWPAVLTRPNDFLLRSNDLYEVRTYDRAIRMARGRIVCLLQDDDLPPRDDGWVRKAQALFSLFPKLMILGGRQGFDLLMPDPVVSGKAPDYLRVGDTAGRRGIMKYRIYERPLRSAGHPAVPFMFTAFINRAPMFVRRDAFLELGGIRQEFAPYQCDDVDCCLRAWLAGYQVGYYASGFELCASEGGMRVHNRGTAASIAMDHWEKIYGEYGGVIGDGTVARNVVAANAELHRENPRGCVHVPRHAGKTGISPSVSRDGARRGGL